jgi:hypothetical protein
MNDVFIKIIEVYRKAFCYKGVADCERYFFYGCPSSRPVLLWHTDFAAKVEVWKGRSWHEADISALPHPGYLNLALKKSHHNTLSMLRRIQ